METIKPACADARNAFGKPDAGNPHVRFDEGGGADKTVPPLLDREDFLYTRFLTKAGLVAFAGGVCCLPRSLLVVTNQV